MNELTIINQNGGAYIDSREVAEIIGKRHDHLLRDIGKYREIMAKSIAPKFGVNDFFLESSYLDSIGRTLPCYLLSKMGCEMVANKLTGEKGVLFTAAYVTVYNEMEQREREEIEAFIGEFHRHEPRLGEINACVRIIVKGMKNLDATPEQILRFIKKAYEPLGISVEFDPEYRNESAPRWYRAGEIAEKCDMYSLYGKPHSQAAACILNEIVYIGAEHKRLETEQYGDFINTSVRYDKHALKAVKDWLVENEYPDNIYGFDRTYHVEYSFI